MLKGKEQKPVVLQVLPAMGQGGVERGTLQVAEYLKEKGIENFVAADKGYLSRRLKNAKVKQFVLPLSTKNYFKLRSNAKVLEKIIRDNNINIVHARSRAPAWSAYWAAKKTGAHFVTTFHGTYGLGPLGIKKIYNKVMTLGERVIAISSHIKNHILKNYKDTNEKNIRLIHRCVDIDDFNPKAITSERMIKFIEKYNLPNDRKIILATGRLTHWKGQHLLLEALGKIKEMNFHLILLGDAQGRNKYVEHLKSLIEKHNLAGKVTFIGHTDDVPALMMLCSVITSTALEPEAFGRMTIEGQIMGKITVASNIGGSLENLKDGKTGRLFKSGDVESLVKALKWALSLSEKEKQEIAKNAEVFVKENFTKQIMCDKTLKVYEELLEG